MNPRSLGLACLVAFAAPACSGPTEAPTDAIESVETTGTSTAAATVERLYATEASLTLSFETLGTFETRNGVRSLILHATANRYLSNVFSYVPDDAFGEAHIISERRLEVVLPEGHELNSVLAGLPLFVTVDTFTGTPTHYTARIEVAPRFYDFRGSNAVWVSEDVTPYYVVNGLQSLVYRGNVDAAASSLTVTAPDGIPAVGNVDADSFKLDWSYDTLKQAMDPHTTPLTFTAALNAGGTAQKTGRLVGRVTSLALTTGDAYDVWPSPTCQPATYDCVQNQPAGTTDFSACGTYRQVTRCLYVANACDVGSPQPLSLTSINASSLEPARVTWNVGSNNGAWHGLSPITAFRTPSCPATPPTIQTVVAKVAEQDQSFPDPAGGTYTNRAGLSQSILFTSNYYGDGAALLQAIDAFAGGGDVQAWLYTQGVPCPNCHEFDTRAVLYYPATRKVVVLDGYYGYDS
ncbi:hypothetical protein D7Y13_38655 [Corallococcus praedator]|uniref:Lipoprotein n=1 Tax=Corallococcus praedator TaxID=2316724 RepID=A0ABX9Q7S0_9BACT|nr:MULTISPECIES: hypothetical protein [Corallococcus]RKH17704.1 hypothetical protein D7X74_11550 [Corallococcus sp. CA047B]RKH18430.1 hypothetical protein D7X75_39565 [Corallococcus sp. CA031C]RKH91541.1 hypothetical protein D7Y13_38655 [Corallococcus praedator]